MARFQKLPTSTFSPYYGCAIMLMAILIFGGIIGWSAYSLFTQDKEIAKITVDEPIKFPPVEMTPEARSALEKRLTDFADAVQKGAGAEITLTIADLNNIISIAPDTGYGSYADLVRLESTIPEKDAIVGQVCLPMNRLKFWEGKKRYLIGELTYYIHVHEEGVDAKVVDVQIPGKDVPDGFVNGMEMWPWVAPYRKVEPIGTILKAIRSAKVTPEGVILSTVAPQSKEAGK